MGLAVIHSQRQQWSLTIWLIVLAIGWQLSDSQICGANDIDAADDPQSRQQASETLTATLPAPPEAIAKLIADGKVVFDFYDQRQHKFDFAGETTFDFRYEYRCTTRFRVIDQPVGDSGQEKSEGKALEVLLHYDEVSLKISHRMRLPERMVNDDFFDQRLVKHEFDHVAISADPRLPRLLIEMLKDRNSKLIVPISQQDVDLRDRQRYAKAASAAAKEETAKVFEDFVSLVRIRYKELDRVTRHGIDPLTPETRQRLLTY